MINISITVWQFVRIMVQIEKNREDKNSELSMDGLWNDIWQEIDTKLIKLGNDNFEEYSELMMNNEVSLSASNSDFKNRLQTNTIVTSQ